MTATFPRKRPTSTLRTGPRVSAETCRRHIESPTLRAASDLPLSASTNTIQELGKLDARRPGGLRQETGRSHARQRVYFQAPKGPGTVASEVGAAVYTHFQHTVCPQGIVAEDRGLCGRDIGGEHFSCA